MPIFTNYSAIWGSLIFLGLIVVYIYKRRSRNIVVSSLMFFSNSKSTAEGGQKLHKLQTPPIFFLEILIFIMFLLAIANPIALHRGQLIPLTIVLDDSLSMTAGKDDSAYNKSLKYLNDNIFNKSIYSITLIKSGVIPQIIGQRDMTPIEARNKISEWKCESPNSNIMIAVSQAIEMSGGEGIVLVLTDHLNNDVSSSNLKWVAFGKTRDNIAITAASRTANGRIDRCFFEFTNFSAQAKDINAEILDINNNKVLEAINDVVESKSSRRYIIKTTEQNSNIKAVIKEDEVDFDNEVVLLPIKRKKIKVGFNLENKSLLNVVKRAVLSTELADISSVNPQVIISDKKVNGNDSLLTQLVIHNATQSLSIVKNISADKEHCITSDLPIDNAIWTADSKFKQIGKNLLVAGNLPLICVDEESNNWNTVYFNYTFNNSNLHLTTFWPVFFYNIMEWAMQHQVGPVTYNYKSGSQIEIRAENLSEKISINKIKKENDEKDKKESYVNNGKVVFVAGSPGLYEIKEGEKKYTVSVNLCSHEESDLSNADTSNELPEIIAKENMNHFESVKWWFIMAAFVLLLLHQWLIARRRSGYAF